MRTRLVSYAPFGALRGVLPDALSTKVVTPIGQLSTADLHYPRAGVNAFELDGITEVAFEYYDGAAWQEPANCRFLTIRGSFDHLEEVQTRKYQGLSIGWMLRKARVWEPNGLPVDADGKVQFNSATAGAIMATLIANAKGRGWGAGLSVDFTATADSAGAAWTKQLTIAYDLELDLDAILANLHQQGVCDFRWQGRTLQIFNPDTAMGRDLTTGTSPLQLLVAAGQTSAPEEWTNEDLLTHARVLGEEGKSWTFDNGTGSGPLGRLENVITQGGVSDPGTAALLADAELLAGSATRFSYTREFELTDAGVWPYRDYQLGDWVSGQRGTTFERLRTASISVTVDRRGARGHAVLGDRLEDLLTKLAKRQRGITGGTSAGGSGVRPAPEGPDKRNPAAPTGLVVGVEAYIDDNGLPQGRVDIDWAHSGQATNGTVMEIDRFQVYYRINETGRPWLQLLSTQDTEAAYSPLPIFKSDGTTPQQYGFKVRAISRSNGYASDFTGVVAVTMQGDTVAPPVPYFVAADVKIWLRTATLTWNGKGTTTGTNQVDMPRDFNKVLVYRGTSPTGPWTNVGESYAPGMVYAQGAMPIGTTWFALSAVDRSGNESAKSAVQSVVSAANVDLAEITAVIDAATVQLQNVGSESLKSGAVLAEKLAQNAVTQEKLAQVIQDDIAKGVTALGNYSQVSQDINTLQTSVNGKNKIVNSTSDANTPASYVAGDRWQKWTTLGVGGKLTNTWRHNGSIWVAESLDPAYLPLVDIGQGTFGELSGSRLIAGSVRTNALMVTDPLDLAPNMAEDPTAWDLEGGAAIINSTTDLSGKRVNVTDNTVTAFARAPFRQVRPEEKIFAAATLYRSAGSTQPAYLIMKTYDKNKAYLNDYQFGAATDSPNGTVFSKALTVPAGVAYIRITLAFGAGTGSAGFLNPRAYKQTDTVLIANGAVTANEVNASSVAGAVGSFIELNVSQLRATTASMGTAVVDKLYSDVVRSRKITTDLLHVGRGANGIVDAYFEDTDFRTVRGNEAGWGTYGTNAPTGLRFYGSGALDGATSRTFHFSTTPGYDKNAFIPVEPGQKWRLNAMFTASGGGARATVRIIYRDGTSTYTADGWNSIAYEVGGAQKTFERIYTVPSNAAYIMPAVQFAAACTTAYIYAGATFTNMATASLIVDGAVIAKHLTVTEEMWAKVIKFKLITGDEIDVNTITSDEAKIGVIRGGVLINDAVTTGALKADAITSKHTITGATIQTTATANRGIKQTVDWLRAWDALGNKTFELGANSGNVYSVGEFKSALDGNYVRMFQTGTGGKLQFMTGSGTGRGHLWANATDGGRIAMAYGSVEEPSDTLPVIVASATKAYMRYGSRAIQVWDNNGVEELLIDATDASVVLRGNLDMRSGRTTYRYGSAAILAYVGQRTESGATPDFEIRPVEGGIRLVGLVQNLSGYSTTTTAAANLNIDATGLIRRSTSSSRGKEDIRTLAVPSNVLDVKLKDWRDKADRERLDKMERDEPRPMTQDKDHTYRSINRRRIPGLLAEDLVALGLDEFVIYGPDGQTEGVLYDAFALAQIAALKEKLDNALGRIKVLETAKKGLTA